MNLHRPGGCMHRRHAPEGNDENEPCHSMLKDAIMTTIMLTDIGPFCSSNIIGALKNLAQQ